MAKLTVDRSFTLGISCFFVIFLFHNCFAVLPPIGDVNCLPEDCKSVVCKKVDCPFGKLMVDPDIPCGCCKMCISYIGLNETCGLSFSNRECGPGLTCISTGGQNSEDICTKMDTPCFQAQEDYDAGQANGNLGMYETRPNCDANGDFTGRRCQPGGSCYCVNKNGNRIFGESAPNNAMDDTAMNCECSRAYQSAMDDGSLFRTVQFPHCLPNGNYDSLQCMSQACFCINPIDRSLNSTVQPFTALTELPCYKPEVHAPGYFRSCEMEAISKKSLTSSYERQNITILGIEQPECSPDGFYNSLRQTETTLYCADPFGKKIENFEVGKEQPSAKDMNCKCARTRHWLSSQQTTKPICCINGNYRPIQCRGGVCFCVDTDGNQSGIEVQANKLTELSCSKDNEYPNC